MNKRFYTYLHCKPNGDIFYVGKGTHGASHEERSHALRKDRNKWHRNIVNKYGKENILIYVFQCDTEEQAYADEIHQISQLRNLGEPLVNMTDGGDGVRGKVVTEETKAKIRAKRLGIKLSEETKFKISQWHKNKKISDETKLKLSESVKRYWLEKRITK